MSENPEEVLKHSKALLAAHAKNEERQELLEKLPQGHGSGLDADMVDGLHAVEIVAKGQSAGGGGGAGGGGDMEKSVYDTDDDGVVDDSEKLEGSTKAEVQDHPAKEHDLGSDRHPDVNVSSPADGQVLLYDGESEEWKNSDPDVTVVGDDVGLAKDVSVLSGLTDATAGHKVTKVEFTWNGDGTVDTIKYYDGANLLFTLTFAYGGGNILSITRS